MQLVFGPNETFFFNDGSGNLRWRAWPAFDRHMASKQFGQIQAVTLGEGETFWISYKAPSGLMHHNDWEDPHETYAKLGNWLLKDNIPHNYSTVTVHLGENGSFFASSDQGHRWKGLPEPCIDYYQKLTRPDLFLKSRVNEVDLGHSGTFLGIGIDSTWFWNLGDEYPELSKLLGQKGITGITYMTINPFAPNQHFVSYSNRTVHWSLPPQWIRDMQSLFQDYAAQAGARAPQAPRPPMKPTTSGKWKPWRKGSNASPQQFTQPSPGSLSPTQSLSEGPYGVNAQGGGSGFDFNQAMGLTQSALDAYNNVQGGGVSGGVNGLGNGLQMANNLANNGLMIGQLAATSCLVM